MKTSSNKRTYFLLGLLVISVIAWFLTKPSGLSVVEYSGEELDNIGIRANTLLAEVQSINFDFSVLQNPEFTALIDQSEPLPSFPVGRSNPFAPAP